MPTDAPAPVPAPPAAPLFDRGAEEFRARPELEMHLAEALVRALQKHGDLELVVDRTEARRTLGAHRLLVVALALAAKIRATVPEPRVGIVLPPGLGGFIANFAVLFAGKTPVNLNFTIGRAALESSLRKAGIRTTLSADAFRQKLGERIPDLPWSERVLDTGAEIASLGKAGLAARLLAVKTLPAELLLLAHGVPREGGDREAALLFTSGSSGEPKGVVLTHRNILGNCAQIDACGILPAGETILANLPIFHSFGFTITLWYAILRGIRVVTVPSPLDTRKCADAVRDEKVTVIVGTPTFLRPYLKRVEPADLASLKLAIGGAEKTPAGFHEAWEERFGGHYFEGYGTTETSPVISVNLPPLPGADPRETKRAGSVGRLFAGMAARVVDPDTGRDADFGQPGVLWLRGVNVFPGYLEQPEATAAAFRDGWYVTGDIVRLDRDGFIYIEGRLSRFSKIGGEMVPHGTVEAAIIEAFGLQGAETPVVAVGARLDPAKGEALVLLAAIDLSPDEVRDKLTAAGLANLWIPREIKRVPAIPMLASGKLDLRKLKELAAG